MWVNERERKRRCASRRMVSPSPVLLLYFFFVIFPFWHASHPSSISSFHLFLRRECSRVNRAKKEEEIGWEEERQGGGGKERVRESESENEKERERGRAGERRVVRSVRVPFISRKLCQTKEIEIVRGKWTIRVTFRFTMILEFKVFKIYARQLRRQEGQEESKGNSIGFFFIGREMLRAYCALCYKIFYRGSRYRPCKRWVNQCETENEAESTHIYTHTLTNLRDTMRLA